MTYGFLIWVNFMCRIITSGLDCWLERIDGEKTNRQVHVCQEICKWKAGGKLFKTAKRHNAWCPQRF